MSKQDRHTVFIVRIVELNIGYPEGGFVGYDSINPQYPMEVQTRSRYRIRPVEKEPKYGISVLAPSLGRTHAT